jgi:ubiquinone/menaquinone biosynthesis C-methylase UbiE
MIEMWNKRYSETEYAYGIEANVFFKSEIAKLRTGTLLLPAEGEGRNACFAALANWDVMAFDFSEEGHKKAIQLAKFSQVSFHYEIASFDSIDLPKNYFDCLALIYAHMPAGSRQKIHRKMLKFLKPGGTVIIEAFSKEQLQYNTGGPKDVSMLFSEEELTDDFSSLSSMEIATTVEHLEEGVHHKGASSVVRLVGKK